MDPRIYEGVAQTCLIKLPNSCSSRERRTRTSAHCSWIWYARKVVTATPLRPSIDQASGGSYL